MARDILQPTQATIYPWSGEKYSVSHTNNNLLVEWLEMCYSPHKHQSLSIVRGIFCTPQKPLPTNGVAVDVLQPHKKQYTSGVAVDVLQLTQTNILQWSGCGCSAATRKQSTSGVAVNVLQPHKNNPLVEWLWMFCSHTKTIH
ncbi:hypothetical protein PoB_006182000 [Plakobranchus ocellatus]|uniref:Uncharacterized protein n=1 Tax=Plakobranchus ocellatus TaxID=259542 RepID=A0AAV4CU43_9GAST|nr:hypothetical protein PoB_006182000 [Plakobranchus ocellatus]